MKKISKIRTVLWLLMALLMLTAAGAGLLYLQLRASLAQLDGEIIISGLSADVRIERDELGTPTIQAENRLDIARAIGFLHAQERFFQMDLARRLAAGELAELFGEAALPKDRETRIHRFRQRAAELLSTFPANDLAILSAYSEGVNSGLQQLSAAPFEYWLLWSSPRPWTMEDSVLTIYAMYLDLHDETARFESTHGLIHDLLPESLYDFLAPPGTEWDAPLQGEALVNTDIPGPEVFDLRAQTRNLMSQPGNISDDIFSEPVALGSNNWAVAGNISAHGGALLANDMHLGLRVPNTWYRAQFIYPGDDAQLRITGVTLPGVPAIVVGSNEKIAWGFTNSYGDWNDLVIVEAADEQPDAYLTADGVRQFQRYKEIIEVKNGPEVSLEIIETIWGPVIDKDHSGRQRALRWVAHDPEAINMQMLRLESAQTVTQAIAIANRSGQPAQNFVVTDSNGAIGWTIAGPIPRRLAFDHRTPHSWADGNAGWDGWLSEDEYPRVINPSSGRIWTANARVVGGADLHKLGDGGYVLGARARQIRDGLFAVESASEQHMLALQLDDEAVFLSRWRDLLLAVLTPDITAKRPLYRELRQHLENWGGRASVNSVGYRAVRGFRLLTIQKIMQPLQSWLQQSDLDFNLNTLKQTETAIWQLLSERPQHWLNPRYPDWDALLLAGIDALLEQMLTQGAELAQRNWGEYNTLQMQHPLSRFIPLFGERLNMPATPLPGDNHMPRIQRPRSGASQRMVVSPGREKTGFFHMPGGQSAHPLSPFYAKGHDSWVNGVESSFLPGPAKHVLFMHSAINRSININKK